MKALTEAQEQAAVIEWCAWLKIPVFHIPNGGSRDVREAANLKRQGVKAGVPDLFVPLARGGKYGLFIEMKRTSPRKGQLSKAQQQWLNLLSNNGYAIAVAYGAKQAQDVIMDYLRDAPTGAETVRVSA